MASRLAWQEFSERMASTIFDEGRILPGFGAYNHYWLARTYNWSLLGFSKAPTFLTTPVRTAEALSWLPSGSTDCDRAYAAQLTVTDSRRPIFVLDEGGTRTILDGVHRVVAAGIHGISTLTVVFVSRELIGKYAVVPDQWDRARATMRVQTAMQPPFEPVSRGLTASRATLRDSDGRPHPNAFSMVYCATDQLAQPRSARRRVRKDGQEPLEFAVEIANGVLGLLQPDLPFRSKPQEAASHLTPQAIAEFKQQTYKARRRPTDGVREALLLVFFLKLARHVAAAGQSLHPEQNLAGYLSGHPVYRSIVDRLPGFRGDRLGVELAFAREIEALLPPVFQIPMPLRSLCVGDATSEREFPAFRLLQVTLLALSRAKEWRSAKFRFIRYNKSGHANFASKPKGLNDRRRHYGELTFGAVALEQVDWRELLLMAALSRVNPGLLWHELRWAVPIFDMMIACADLMRMGRAVIPVWAAEAYLQHRSASGAGDGNHFAFAWNAVDEALHLATPWGRQIDALVAEACLRSLLADKALLIEFDPASGMRGHAVDQAFDNWLTLGFLA